MKIAVLAWGSLIQDSRDLAIEGSFRPIGPSLPVEFSRISNDKRLTLVIDEAIGASCLTYAARSAIEHMEDALINLWRREGSDTEGAPANVRTSGRVGFVDIKSGERSAKATDRHPKAVEAMRTWGREHGYGAVIWTSLAGNFMEKRGADFSVDTALAHLAGLSSLERNVALDYIRQAPSEVQTPVRAAVNEHWPLHER